MRTKPRRSSRVRKKVKERMAVTGEKYTQALRAVEAEMEQETIAQLDAPLSEEEEAALEMDH